MNAKFKDIVGRIETWPDRAQERAADLLLTLEHEYIEPYELTDEDRAAIDRSLEEARQGRFATDKEVEAAFNRFRR